MKIISNATVLEEGCEEAMLLSQVCVCYGEFYFWYKAEFGLFCFHAHNLFYPSARNDQQSTLKAQATFKTVRDEAVFFTDHLVSANLSEQYTMNQETAAPYCGLLLCEQIQRQITYPPP